MTNRFFFFPIPVSVRMIGLIILTIVISTVTSVDVVTADGEEPHPAITDTVPEIDMTDSELLINLKISVDPNGELTLKNHHFREAVISSPIATPWFWAARIITFDNRCSRLSPLEDPTISRFIDPENSDDPHHPDEAWGKNSTATELVVELPVDAGMHEIEILNSDYEIVANYNAAILLDSFCEGDPENSLCKLRKSLLILLDDDDGMEDFSIESSDSFQDLNHLEKVSEREGYKLLSADETPLYLVDLANTSFPWDQAHSITNPFESPSGKGVYNGYKGLRSGEINEYEGSLRISLQEPAKGIGMKLGFMTPSQVMKQDDVTIEMAKILADYEEDIPSELIEKVSKELIGTKEPVVASFAVYDSEGKKINSAEKTIAPLPGLHTFVGLITPNNTISYIDIKYSGSSNSKDASAEFITDVLLFSADAEKLDPRPFEINDKPCESPILFYTGIFSDFKPLPELDRFVAPEPQDDNPGDVANPTPTPIIKSPVVPTPTSTPTVTPPRPELSGPRSGTGVNPLTGGSSSDERPVVADNREQNNQDEDTQEGAASCNLSSGGQANSIGLVITLLIPILFRFKRSINPRKQTP